MAAGYARATGRVGVCMVTSGPGATNTVTPVRDCMADSSAARRDLRAGGARVDRNRCLPGSARAFDHGRGRQARVSGHRPGAARVHRANGVRDRPYRAARGRSSWTCRRTCRTGRAFSRAAARCAIPGYRRRMHELAGRILGESRSAPVFRHAGRSAPAADLRRRRRDQCRSGARRSRSLPRRFRSRW